MAAIINVNNISAGVYETVKDTSQFKPQISVTIGGIVGVADKGPVGIPTLLTGQDVWDSTFGTPSLDGAGGITARNLLGEINQIWYTRIATPNALASSGDLFAPSTSAQLLGSHFARYTFGFGQTNNQFLIGVDNQPIQGLEFPDGTENTADLVATLAAVFLGVAQVTETASGYINVTSLSEGTGSVINIPQTAAATTLGFTPGVYAGTNSTAAFLTSTNSSGLWPSQTFNGASELQVEFDNDPNLIVTLTGPFIDGINNVVDLVTQFNNFAGNNVSTALANSAAVDHEKIRITSASTGTGSVVKILGGTSADVLSVLGFTSGEVNSGVAATSATLTNLKKQGYDLSTATTLKFQVDGFPQKNIDFSTSGNAAYSILSFTSGSPITAGLSVTVSDWTYTFQTSSGALNTTNKTFNVKNDASDVLSWQHLTEAVNLYNTDVTAAFFYSGGAGGSGTVTITADTNGFAGNNIAFNTTNVTSFYTTKNPTNSTLGYGNGSVINDITQSTIQDTVEEINRQAGGIYAFQDNGVVMLASPTLGSSSTVTIVGSNTAIGFISGQVGHGLNRTDLFSVTANTPGIWADGYKVVTTATGIPATPYGINVLNPNNVVVEQFAGTTINALTSFIETQVNANSNFIRVKYLGAIAEVVPAGIETTLVSGDSGSFVTDQDVIGGISLYSDKEKIAITLFATPGYFSTPVLTALSNLATTRQDCFVLVDPPSGFTPQQVVNWHNGVIGSGNTLKLDNLYEGLYWPYVRINDDQNGIIRLVPPSTVMMELMAANDNQSQPYTAPAGTVHGLISRALDIEYSANQAERDLLQSDPLANNVNPIINLLGVGICSFGQKTLQREMTSLNRINVSRLLIFVRRSIKGIALPLVFSPNDSNTWDIFVTQASKFLNTVVANQGIVQFKVVMDSTVNTPQTIAQGILFGFVIIKPVIVAEKIVLTFQVTGQDFSFTT